MFLYRCIFFLFPLKDHFCIFKVSDIAKMLTTHRPLILNYFRAKKQFYSGISEGLNRKINLTIRKSFGFRTIKICLYQQLGVLPEPEFAQKFWCRGRLKNDEYHLRQGICTRIISFGVSQSGVNKVRQVALRFVPVVFQLTRTILPACRHGRVKPVERFESLFLQRGDL